jgi:hypothetical protein
VASGNYKQMAVIGSYRQITALHKKFSCMKNVQQQAYLDRMEALSYNLG